MDHGNRRVFLDRGADRQQTRQSDSVIDRILGP
jgi:hypothetical protein